MMVMPVAAVVAVIPGSLTGGGNGTATTASTGTATISSAEESSRAGGRLVAPVDPAQGAVCRGEKQGELGSGALRSHGMQSDPAQAGAEFMGSCVCG